MGFKWLRGEPVVGTRAMQNTKGTHVAVVMGQWRGKPDAGGTDRVVSERVFELCLIHATGFQTIFASGAKLEEAQKYRKGPVGYNDHGHPSQ